MALVDIQVPDIGDFDEVGVIELLVKVGDTVKAEQSLITVESDKASMEIPSSHAGVVKELKIALGDKVKQGSVIAVVESADAVASAPAAAPAPAAVAPAPVAAAAPAPVAPAAAPATAGPVEVRVPDIGDFKDVAVIELLVKVGDTIKLEQSLFTVESDKASMEIPSPAAGVVKELKVKLDVLRDQIRAERARNRKLIVVASDLLAMLKTASDDADTLDDVTDGYSHALTQLLSPDAPTA